jgi:hypothetical protein
MSAAKCCTGNCRQGRDCIATRCGVVLPTQTPFWQQALAAVLGASLIAGPFVYSMVRA